ncbi:hypothetical protein B5F53_15320 [Blautia sp. An249]|uniref:hypothetical protein n=1 Tax=Blautia sp. An249 TaxID=1965603 RepID=UPI000B37F0E5|nr:hypothetical protein [Blautia sp. An249]OUO76945.1 hypothetical protein B5F53_15320 [Blautia sp. An249]
MKDNKIHIPGKKVTVNEQGTIKLTKEASEALAEVVNESTMSIKQVASLIIVQAIKNDLIVFDREE